MLKNSAIVILVIGLGFILIPCFNPGEPLRKAGNALQSQTFEPVVVLELFTSQGCSSCPPADMLLHELATTSPQALYAVSYHVDYWNYIGWKDPFSKSEYTAMQSSYNDKLRNQSNYTPEMVINGKEHMVGSDAAKIKSRIKAYSNEPATNSVVLSKAHWDDGGISVQYKVEGDLTGKYIKGVVVLGKRETYVKRGENSGRTLLNSQIAIAVREQSLNHSEGSLQFPVPGPIIPGESLYVLVMTQNRDHDITGASRIEVPGKS